MKARHQPARRAAYTAVALALGMLGHASAQSAAVGTGAGWESPGGDAQGTRYSQLFQITTANVATLVPEFTFATNHAGSQEGQPLVVGSVMYVLTPFPHTLTALDLAHPGQTLWTFTPPSNGVATAKGCCDVVNRGASYSAGKIVFNTLDGKTIALDAATGAQLWSTQLADPTTGTTLTGAPIVADGVVIVGNAGGEFGVRGWVTGLSLATGAQKWRAFSTGPDADVRIGAGFKPFYAKDQGTDLGTTSWGGTNMWQHGGGTAWSWITYDPETDLLFYGTSNPGIWNADMRPGADKWGATIFARKPQTGQAVWAYQTTPHDGWDFDATNESILVDQDFAGVPRKLLVHFDKNGFAYTMDRTTGQVLKAEPFVPVTWATGVNLVSGAPAVAAGKLPHTGQPTAGICPTPLGGKEFVPASFSPATGLFYVPTNNLCTGIEPLKAVYIKGAPFIGADISIVPGAGGNLGALVAWNAVTGKPAWQSAEALPVYAGTLATAGGLVFYGTLDRHFKARNARTGALLFDTVLDCGVVSNPISYKGPDGKQRVAVYSGVGWLPGGFAGGACPSEPGTAGGGASSGTGTSGELHVFKLP